MNFVFDDPAYSPPPATRKDHASGDLEGERADAEIQI